MKVWRVQKLIPFDCRLNRNVIVIAEPSTLLYGQDVMGLCCPRSIMNEDVADGIVVDLRGADMMNLLIDAAGTEMKTALDRLLISNASGNNGFNNSIDLSR
jgi:hypothetical protein